MSVFKKSKERKEEPIDIGDGQFWMPPKTTCVMAHQIKGIIPNFSDPLSVEHLEGSVCDCGKLKIAKEECGCPNIPFKIMWIEND